MWCSLLHFLLTTPNILSSDSKMSWSFKNTEKWSSEAKQGYAVSTFLRFPEKILDFFPLHKWLTLLFTKNFSKTCCFEAILFSFENHWNWDVLEEPRRCYFNSSKRNFVIWCVNFQKIPTLRLSSKFLFSRTTGWVVNIHCSLEFQFMQLKFHDLLFDFRKLFVFRLSWKLSSSKGYSLGCSHPGVTQTIG